MKKLWLAPLLVAIFAGGYLAHRPQAKVETNTVVKTVQVVKPVPVFHLGDTQQGVTLIGVYPYNYQNQMAGNSDSPPVVHLVYFVLSGVADLTGHTQVLAADNTFLVTDGPANIPACGNNPCVGYIATSPAASFYYKNLKWSL